MDIKDILEKLENGELRAEDALSLLGAHAEDDLGFARVDLQRAHRRGMPEVVFSEGKTPGQIVAIVGSLRAAEQNVLCTRASAEVYEAVSRKFPEAEYHEAARIVSVDTAPHPEACGQVAIVCAGTSDIPVAEEAAITAEWMGARVIRIFDVGVAGLHRLMNHLDTLRSSRAVIVVAGMEGALPSVVGGLIDRPIVAVPTSIGYGTHMKGLAPLLAMLNTCVPGISVVNVDNGFGAGVSAALINRTGESPS